ncbi:hypothetical protein QBC44DRAFT_374224 [Cladorrhinum sp. PSN332]|nr:hypothetical protein QBC44DRAFT_374224 [Cladorrhinum sp. PSN332]
MLQQTPLATIVALLSFLTPLALAEPSHPMITPAAMLRARATGAGSGSGGSDCDASLGAFMSCAGDGMSADLCLGTASTWNVDSTCACSQATSLYNCYTKYCAIGTEFSNYYTGVSWCASKGFGAQPPKPTGAQVTALGGGDNGNNGNNGGGSGGSGSGSGSGSSGASILALGDAVLWGVWGVVGLGVGVGMLV